MIPLNNENWIYPWLAGGYNMWPVIGQKESNFQTPAEMRKKKYHSQNTHTRFFHLFPPPPPTFFYT
jgi:hypothetical protein